MVQNSSNGMPPIDTNDQVIVCAANPGLAGFYTRSITLRRRGADDEVEANAPVRFPIPLRKVAAI